MADRYVFADEAGNFDFSNNRGATRYFVLSTVTMNDCALGHKLLQLRRDMAWRGMYLNQIFHATEDLQAVRDEVFALIATADIRVDATILEKCKAQPHLQSEGSLYKIAWYLHFKYVAPIIASADDRLMVTAASVGSTKRKRASFHDAVGDVVFQVAPCLTHRVAFWSADSDPCLQVADYCNWAIQRKWEHKDPRSYEIIRSKIRSEYDIWQRGTIVYY